MSFCVSTAAFIHCTSLAVVSNVDVCALFFKMRVTKADEGFCVCRLEFERQQREELEKLELRRYKSLEKTRVS